MPSTSFVGVLVHRLGCDGLAAILVNARCPNENGDVESFNGHIKNRIDQALLLRGSRDFESREDYMAFVEQVVAKGNKARSDRFAVEQQQLAPLPDHKIDCHETLCGIRVRGVAVAKLYTKPSRLAFAAVR